MTFAAGDDFVSGSILSFQQMNRIKNHFRLATAPGSPVGGMVFSDSDDDKLYHYGSAWEEVLQLTRSADVSPQFAAVRLMDTGADHYLGVSWNEDDSAHRTLTLLVNGANAILDIDTKEVLGVGQVLRENLIGNSAFGVWSQSDTAKGLGSLTYDTGDDGGGDIPDVGDAVTGDDSGATGKIISMTIATGTFAGGDATGVITLGACTGCFNDNEALSFTDGETAVVNQPDGAVGADGIVKNGAFVTDNDPPNDWTSSGSATITTEAGGQVGNCAQVQNNGATDRYIYQSCTTVVGKIYTCSVYAKKGTGTGAAVYVGTAAVNYDYLLAEETGGAWVEYTVTFEATTTTTFISLRANGADGQNCLFDEVTLYEITPCCTAADAVAFDGWLKDATLDLYRQHNDGGTLTKDGSFYALKAVPTAADDYFGTPVAGIYATEDWVRKFDGRTVAFGMWVKTSTASHCRLKIDHNGTDVYSDYHTGGGAYEWLEVPLSPVVATSSAPVFFVFMEAAPNIDGSTIVYISQPMLVFGSYIGEGNYKPIPQEIIWLEKYILSNTLHSNLAASDVAYTDLNVEADVDAKLPKGCKSLTIWSRVRDSGSAGADSYLGLRGDSTKDEHSHNSCYGLANDAQARATVDVPCGPNGDIDYRIEASGAGTFDLLNFWYKAVQVN